MDGEEVALWEEEGQSLGWSGITSGNRLLKALGEGWPNRSPSPRAFKVAPSSNIP
jgi:hypothetical protein